MTRVAAIVLSLTLSSCCCGKKTENFVTDAPTTTKEAQKRAAPPHVTVDVTRITKSSGGGGGACHSAVCLLFVPVIIYGALFPEKYDLVVIKTDGVETFSGSYSTGGDLLTGVVHLPDGVQKQVQVLSLDELNKNTIVEAARLKPASDGGLDRIPTPLQTQHDFLADYRAALKGTTDWQKRGKLLNEAFKWLDDEASPLLLAQLKDPAEPDAAKAALLAEVCRVGAPQEKSFLDAVGEQPGPFTALVLTHCATAKDRVAANLARAIAGGCLLNETEPFARFNQALMDGLDPALKAEAAKAGQACAKEDKQALFALQLGGPVGAKGLAAALDGPHSAIAITRVDLKDPAQRGAWFAALGKGATTELFLKRIPDDDVLTPVELAEVARAYTADRVFFSRDRERGMILGFLVRHAKGVDAKQARAVLAAHRDTLKEGDRPVFDVALVALGDKSRMPFALKGGGAPYREGFTSSERDLVNYGLELSGCTPAEVKAWCSAASKGLRCATHSASHP